MDILQMLQQMGIQGADRWDPQALQRLGGVLPHYQQYGQQYGVNPALLIAQGYQESRFNPQAGSPAGARGISQFMPGTAQRYNVNVNDPADSIRGQAQYMADIAKMFPGSPQKQLAGYNWGENRNILKSDMPWEQIASRAPRETQGYVSNILGMLDPNSINPAMGAGRVAMNDPETFDEPIFQKGSLAQYLPLINLLFAEEGEDDTGPTDYALAPILKLFASLR